MQTKVHAAAVFVAMLLTQSCASSWIVNWKSSWPSPDGRRQLIVATVGTKPHLKVTLESEGSERTLFSDGGEWYISFLQTYWSPDSKVCGLYVASDRSFLLAFDAENGRQVDPTTIREGLAADLMTKYRLRERMVKDPSFDPLKWMKSPEAEAAYREATYKQP